MKKIVWLASAIGLTVGSANAQSGTISIVAETAEMYLWWQNPSLKPKP